MLCVDLGFHVVIGNGRLTVQKEDFIRQLHFTTHTQFQVQSSFLLDVVVRLCPVIVNSICVPNSCIFHIAKTGLLRCCLYSHIPICAKGACGWQPGKGRVMPSSSPHQRTNARVSACQAGLGNHTATKPSSTVLLANSSGIHLHEIGLVDTLNDIGREHGLVIGLHPVSRTCIPPRTPGGAIVQPESGSPRRKPRAWGQVRRILHDPKQRDVSCSSAAFRRNLFWRHRPFGKQCNFLGLLL